MSEKFSSGTKTTNKRTSESFCARRKTFSRSNQSRTMPCLNLYGSTPMCLNHNRGTELFIVCHSSAFQSSSVRYQLQWNDINKFEKYNAKQYNMQCKTAQISYMRGTAFLSGRIFRWKYLKIYSFYQLCKMELLYLLFKKCCFS